MRLEMSFAEHMVNEDAIKKCLNPKHNLSALGRDGICYCHLKFGKGPMIKRLPAIFMDCVDDRHTPATWKCSRTALLYKKVPQAEMKNWRPITVTSCLYRLFTAMMTVGLRINIRATNFRSFLDVRKVSFSVKLVVWSTQFSSER
jgi:hypothetical protein